MSKSKKQKKVLGRGLAALLDDSEPKNISFDKSKDSFSSSEEIDIQHIEINPNQPRLNIDKGKLQNLSDSIKELGIIQPITVRKIGSNKYEIISGERRFRASKLAGLLSIPCYIKRIDEETDSLKMALVENVQRVDLDPIEIALTYNRLINELDITQDQLSKIVGKDRTTISNFIRLLKLDPIVQSGIRDGFLTMGHGRALINLENKSNQLDIYEKIISRNLSVRQTESLVKNIKSGNKQSTRSSDVSRIYVDATSKFETFFNSKVNIKESSSGKVSLNAVFENIDKLYEILKKISN
ncbi:MAG: ParB/RepB/Spo0J family partition protein [Bacteroidota bacterium]|nr:ParB/RepB/Spo0J family partition protein [Bacteroidota bacterium]MEC9065539.1 ParB/RepB/Spo0J family partition protein [Bacteroidota bacterium]MED5269338.1 ParB/RepB/Spo0J family partition protein [Bacteroidota bacterium]|tara:strand:+ start:214 stop:1104 length:891 start_codon:yes stop_codon:yes gene_type:complete